MFESETAMHQWLKFVFLLLSISSLQTLAADKSVKVAIGDIYKNQDETKKYGIQVERDLRKIYSDAGIQAEFTYLPSERAIQSVIIGKYDALDMRVRALEKEPQLVKVNVPLVSINLYLYSIDGSKYNRLDDLKDQVVVSFQGTRYTKLLKHYKELYLVQNPKQAALMLTKGRATVWFAPEGYHFYIKQMFPNIKKASPKIASFHLYHYLHISKSHLLGKLEESANHLLKSKLKNISKGMNEHN